MFNVNPQQQQAGIWFESDMRFNRLYSLPVQLLASRHWTALGVVKKAVEFLVTGEGNRILDIGSGAGKFCIAGAFYKPAAFFTGVEQRKNLVNVSRDIAGRLQLDNVQFIHDNFTRLDFRQYDHFYFYNAFYENLSGTDKIDNSIDYSIELYQYYCRYLHNKLDEMPAGTRLVTFHSLENEIPRSYRLQYSHLDNALKFWIKS